MSFRGVGGKRSGRGGGGGEGGEGEVCLKIKRESVGEPFRKPRFLRRKDPTRGKARIRGVLWVPWDNKKVNYC